MSKRNVVIDDWNVRGWYFPAPAGSPHLENCTEKAEIDFIQSLNLKFQESTLVIFHFNDVYDFEANNCGDGGLPRFTAKLNEERQSFHGVDCEERQHLLLFSGDCFSPSRVSSVTKGSHMIEAFNALRVDCAVLGNHELDFGIDNFEQKSQDSQFPWLCSNCWHKENGFPLGKAKEAFITHVNGFRVGIIGLVEELWLSSIKGLDRSTLDYADFVAAGRDLARKLKAHERCDVVIALTHMLERNDHRLAAEAPEIDLILGGHDHEYLTKTVAPYGTTYVKSGTDFHFFSKITLTPRPEAAAATAATAAAVRAFDVNLEKFDITPSTVLQEDPEMRHLCDKYAALFEQQSKKILGQIAQGCQFDTREHIVRTAEASSGNWLCDILRDSVSRDILPNGCDIALINAGAIRANTVYDAGPFTLADLYSILPFTDQTVIKAMTGTQLLEMLELSVNEWPEVNGFFLQVSGVKLIFDGSKAPFFACDPTDPLPADYVAQHGWNGRVVASAVSIGGKPLDLQQQYTVIAPRFLEMKFPSFRAAETVLGPEASPYLKVALNNRLTPMNGTMRKRRLPSFDSVHDFADVDMDVDQSNSRVRNVGVSFQRLPKVPSAPISLQVNDLRLQFSKRPSAVALASCAGCCSSQSADFIAGAMEFGSFDGAQDGRLRSNSSDSDYFFADAPAAAGAAAPPCTRLPMLDASTSDFTVFEEISAAIEGRLVNLATINACISCCSFT